MDNVEKIQTESQEQKVELKRAGTGKLEIIKGDEFVIIALYAFFLVILVVSGYC